MVRLSYISSRLIEFIEQFLPFLLVFFFTYSAVGKLVAMESFETLVKNIPLLGEGTTALIMAYVIPFAELIVALLISFPRTRFSGLLAAASVLLLFTSFIVYILFLNPDTSCSCIKTVSILTPEQQLYLNGGFILLLLFTLKIRKRTF